MTTRHTASTLTSSSPDSNASYWYVLPYMRIDASKADGCSQISRKASTTYYPTLHLELARYVAHSARAGYELPWPVSRLVGVPPAGLAKNPSSAPTSGGRSTPAPQGSPTKRGGVGGAPALPSPRKIEPLKMN